MYQQLIIIVLRPLTGERRQCPLGETSAIRTSPHTASLLTIVKPKSLERLINAFYDVFTTQTTSVVSLFITGAEEDLGGDDDIASILFFWKIRHLKNSVMLRHYSPSQAP